MMVTRGFLTDDGKFFDSASDKVVAIGFSVTTTDSPVAFSEVTLIDSVVLCLATIRFNTTELVLLVGIDFNFLVVNFLAGLVVRLVVGSSNLVVTVSNFGVVSGFVVGTVSGFGVVVVVTGVVVVVANVVVVVG